MKPSTQYCIQVLQERKVDLERSGWDIILREHPDRFGVISYEAALNNKRIEALKEGIKILENL